MREAPQALRADEAARNYFVRYCRLHTDLYQVARASQAGKHALSLLQGSLEKDNVALPEMSAVVSRRSFWQRNMAGAGAIAALLFIGLLTYLLLSPSTPPPEPDDWFTPPKRVIDAFAGTEKLFPTAGTEQAGSTPTTAPEEAAAASDESSNPPVWIWGLLAAVVVLAAVLFLRRRAAPTA